SGIVPAAFRTALASVHAIPVGRAAGRPPVTSASARADPWRHAQARCDRHRLPVCQPMPVRRAALPSRRSSADHARERSPGGLSARRGRKSSHLTDATLRSPKGNTMNPSRRILVAECMQEISSFNPLPSGYENFRVEHGAKMLGHLGRNTALGGALEELQSAGLEPVLCMEARAGSAGLLSAAGWKRLSGEV